MSDLGENLNKIKDKKVVKSLFEMGFSIEEICDAFIECHMNENQLVETLLQKQNNIEKSYKFNKLFSKSGLRDST